MSTPRALIGRGRVWHRRLRPAAHEFTYPSRFLMLPMRSLRAVPCPALRRNRRGLFSFRDADHGDGRGDALAWFDELLAREGIRDATGEVWLMTYPRVLGHVFKPVSFWWAHRADGSLAAMVAEVNNTFGERHCYLLDGPGLADGQAEARKVFHVSPFCAVQGHYRFEFSHGRAPSGDLAAVQVRVDHDDSAGPLLQTRIGGTLQPLDHATVRRLLLQAPWTSLAVIARIHWQALLLWRKRVPFFRQPHAPDRFVTR
jgi:DUF1365 family protein